jgi:hypothetical protein
MWRVSSATTSPRIEWLASDEVVPSRLTHGRWAWRSVTGCAGEQTSDSQRDGNGQSAPDEDRRHEERHPIVLGGTVQKL